MEKYSQSDLISPCNENCSFCFLNYANELGKNYLFRNISAKEIGTIIREVHHQVKEYSKGEIIALAGDEYNRLLIIVKGAVIGEIVDFEGRSLRIEELRAPDTIASAFIFGDDNGLPVNIIATEDTRLLIIGRSDLLTLFRRYETILHNYLNIMANRAQHLSKKIKMLGLQTIKGKIALHLLELMKKTENSELILEETQQELANMFGVTRPSLTRALREMHDEGFIDAKAKSIKILDRMALSKFLR
jgi:CRP/FNR family transcriptional regulator, dissimilatory nitrate respiration regulator